MEAKFDTDFDCLNCISDSLCVMSKLFSDVR
jgi:hypothetical protein